MNRPRLWATAVCVVVVVVGGASCMGTRIQAQTEVVRSDIEKARKSGAYTCAPRELALAESSVDFAENELAQGDFLRAQQHIDLAIENTNQALAFSKDCAPKRVLIQANSDKDGDGIDDKVDACPDVPEDIDLFEDEDGCPEEDNDQDGLVDGDDSCKNTPGPKENGGCPYGDRDGDAINDKADACPEAAEDKDGDRDGDGRPDVDADNDGVEDCVEGCPMPAGQDGAGNPLPPAACDLCLSGELAKEDKDSFEDNDGCAEVDNDKDGVLDAKDACPDVAGPLETRGCPDQDGDKIADGEDKCPTEKGVDQLATDPTRHGCPLADKDGDGFLDNDDACPTEPGIRHEDDPKQNGCPKKFKLIVIKKDSIEIKQQVQFDTGKASIKPASAKLLAEVGDAIRSSELSKVIIRGHTDDVGDDDFNLNLSQERAASVRNWLISKERVKPELLEAVGMGETDPIASNRTSAGRQANRRVEFKVER